ncbi:hypothetical protein CAMSH0001_1112 [Campylobacter showae RM3277]|uniref:Uncharacterized protein n=1 Tax=Campylobacter showae RM3277 TaxID=553219 RepID=C6RI02_9BACT|nr:hypothetical protein CAMSH0001_1112 [Campylobacter showae RM3277]
MTVHYDFCAEIYLSNFTANLIALYGRVNSYPASRERLNLSKFSSVNK